MDAYESLNHTQWEWLYHVLSFPNADVVRCTCNYGSTRVKCSAGWRSRRNAE
jgi:hypothetical protein